ncbi:pyridoxamine 5'-phosphate oxidase [Verrucomicrobia bacterium LW23]|nr:pyridoxamine 5'-phosphate oxidase [Verrucomicrobia bacterium LW23]
MADKYMQIMLTPAVQQAQDHYFGGHDVVENAPVADPLTPRETAFIGMRDSFYMATVSESGWPYVQHRGGPPGFVRVLGPSRLGFADYQGNQQMLSTGNLAASDKVALFMMDYPRRARLKILGHARVVDAREHAELFADLADEALRPRVERFVLIDVVSYDWNCPKYITQRFTAAEVERAVEPLRDRIAELEAQLAVLKGGDGSGGAGSGGDTPGA